MMMMMMMILLLLPLMMMMINKLRINILSNRVLIEDTGSAICICSPERREGLAFFAGAKERTHGTQLLRGRPPSPLSNISFTS